MIFRENPSNPAPSDAANARPGDSLRRDGHVLLRGAEMREKLLSHGGLGDWARFAASWNDLQRDQYMADGGRYRRRRHAVYTAAADGSLQRQPHQPHFQSREYNALNGGIARWFEPIEAEIGAGESFTTILRFCHQLFDGIAPSAQGWHVETHQFRIEASSGVTAQPTPEGAHRDGVDYVLVLLVRRHNIVSGTTTIHTPEGRSLGSFTLTDPFDATLIDDNRVYHGVTPVTPLDPAEAAYRDVLVVTFRHNRAAS